MSYSSPYGLERVDLLTPLYVDNDLERRRLTPSAEGRMRAGGDVDHRAEVLEDGTHVLVETLILPVAVTTTPRRPSGEAFTAALVALERVSGYRGAA